MGENPSAVPGEIPAAVKWGDCGDPGDVVGLTVKAIRMTGNLW